VRRYAIAIFSRRHMPDGQSYPGRVNLLSCLRTVHKSDENF
jgi:hypothetical protein